MSSQELAVKLDEKIIEEEEGLEAKEEIIKEVDNAILLGEGTCFYGIVEKIEVGPLGLFFKSPPKYAKNWEQRKNRLAYRFHIVVPEFGLEIMDVITVSGYPSSRMVTLSKCYNGRLSKGAKVRLCIVNGRPRIECPEASYP